MSRSPIFGQNFFYIDKLHCFLVSHHTWLGLNGIILFWLSRQNAVNIVTTELMFLQKNVQRQNLSSLWQIPNERVSFQIMKFDKPDFSNQTNVGVSQIDLFRSTHLTPGTIFATFFCTFFSLSLSPRTRPTHIWLTAARISSLACSTVLWRSLKRWEERIKCLKDQISRLSLHKIHSSNG